MTERLYVRMDVVISYDIDLAAEGINLKRLEDMDQVRADLKKEMVNLLEDELDEEIMDNLVFKVSVYVDEEPYL